MLRKLFSFFVFGSFWSNPLKNEFGLYDDRGNIFRVEESIPTLNGTTSFHFSPIMKKSSYLQKFTYQKNHVLFDFFHERKEKHYVDILHDDGPYYRMKLNDTTLYHDIFRNQYRRYNCYGTMMLCDLDSQNCNTISMKAPRLYKFIKCLGYLQITIDFNNTINFFHTSHEPLFSISFPLDILDVKVEEVPFHFFYFIVKDTNNVLTIYKFRYEAKALYLKQESTLSLGSHLDLFIQYPYVFVYANTKAIHIYSMDMLSSRYFISPPLLCTEEDKIFFYRKKLFFCHSPYQSNIPYRCLEHFVI